MSPFVPGEDALDNDGAEARYPPWKAAGGFVFRKGKHHVSEVKNFRKREDRR